MTSKRVKPIDEYDDSSQRAIESFPFFVEESEFREIVRSSVKYLNDTHGNGLKYEMNKDCIDFMDRHYKIAWLTRDYDRESNGTELMCYERGPRLLLNDIIILSSSKAGRIPRDPANKGLPMLNGKIEINVSSIFLRDRLSDKIFEELKARSQKPRKRMFDD
jgi:hypothetical protein